MKTSMVRLALAMWSITLPLAGAWAIEVGGGGSQKRDCLVTFDAAVNHPAAKPKHVRCTDGDPACDSDGVVNGLCTFEVRICANSTFNPECTINGVDSIVIDNAIDDGSPKFDPDFQSLQTAVDNDIQPPTTNVDICTATTDVIVPIKGPIGNNRCRRQRKKIKLDALSQLIDGRKFKDRDTLKLSCEPDPNGCEPMVLFSGTFDRIQRQVFNQSCAVSGCHDSQTQAANLLLETGAAYGNLVNQTPSNPSASGDGWLRVHAPNPPGTSGTPEMSYLFRKIDDDLPSAAYGERMPLGKKKLHRTLRDVIELWISDGAPQTGWVPGTF